MTEALPRLKLCSTCDKCRRTSECAAATRNDPQILQCFKDPSTSIMRHRPKSCRLFISNSASTNWKINWQPFLLGRTCFSCVGLRIDSRALVRHCFTIHSNGSKYKKTQIDIVWKFGLLYPTRFMAIREMRSFQSSLERDSQFRH